MLPILSIQCAILLAKCGLLTLFVWNSVIFKVSDGTAVLCLDKFDDGFLVGFVLVFQFDSSRVLWEKSFIAVLVVDSVCVCLDPGPEAENEEYSTKYSKIGKFRHTRT